MAEPSTPCRWGAMSVLMRLKNKIKEKVFWYRILNEPSSPDASESDPSNWTDSQHFDNEGSTSNHPDLQHYFDAPQGFQNPSSQFANLGQNGGLFSQMLHGEGMMLDPLDGSGTSHEQEAFMTLADFDTEDRQQQWTAQMYHRYTTSQYGMAEEYIDARAEMLDDQSSLEHSYSAPPQLGHLLSTVETAEMMDTGDSSNLGPVRQTSAVEWQRILFLQQFLGVDGAVRAGPGWKVVLGIVSAFKRLSGLIRRRRQEKIAEGPTPLATPRRIRSAEITKFKGIRPRKNGKWVSEIRIGGTLEKVWLGSYNTEKEAALAFDAGKHHCSLKRSAKGFNFSDSPRLLGPPQNFAHLSSVERRTRIQRLAEDHARAYASADIR